MYLPSEPTVVPIRTSLFEIAWDPRYLVPRTM